MSDPRHGRQGGWIASAEVIFVLTFVFCGAAVAWAVIGVKLFAEIGDTGSAIGSLNQSYAVSGLQVGHPTSLVHPTPLISWTGSSYQDAQDFCDIGANCGLQLCIPPLPEGASGPGQPLCVPDPNDPSEPPIFELCCLADPTDPGCDCDIYPPGSPEHLECCSILGGGSCDPG